MKCVWPYDTPTPHSHRWTIIDHTSRTQLRPERGGRRWFRPQGNKDRPTAVSELRYITASPIPPARGRTKAQQFSSVLGSETASPASGGRRTHQSRARRCLSDRDQRLHPALPCGGRTYARPGCNSMRSSLLRNTLVPCRLDPRNVGQDAVSKEDRVGFAVQKWSVLGLVGAQATTYNKARHVYKRTRIRRRFCRYGCTVCM